MTSQLVGSDFTSAAQLPNYVNGRLLTAEDLATSQATLRARDVRLGQAAGHGIIDGLWVTASTVTSGMDALTVAPGQGLAPSGDIISVGAPVTLPLTFSAPAASSAAGASFSCCTPAPSAGGSAISAGCYLLTALPACQLTGQAPLASLPDSTLPAGCTAQWQAEGVQFKAIALQLGDAVLGIPVTDDNRRNLLAHWCFGTPQLADLASNLLGFAPGYGGFDTLGATDLSAADLPLAVFYWDGQAVGFTDNWSARRRLTAPDPIPASAPWSGVVSDRRAADGQARLLQFQDQAAELVAAGVAGQVTAAATFPLLPPAGFLPVGLQPGQGASGLLTRLRSLVDGVRLGEQAAVLQQPPPVVAADQQTVLRTLAALPEKELDIIMAAMAANATEPGFDLCSFFGSAATWGNLLDWEIAGFLLRQSWENMPAAAFPQPAEGDPIPLTYYLVLQNYQAALKSGGLYVVFVKNYTWFTGAQLPLLTRPGFGSVETRG